MADASFKVDLTNCDVEPIHIPGSIQPHGAMLVIEGEEGLIGHASANAADVLGCDPKYVIGMPLEEVIGARPAHQVRNAIAKALAPSTPGLVFGLEVEHSAKRFDVAAHAYLDRTYVEFQEGASDVDAYGPLELTRALVRRLADETSVQKLAAMAARMVAMMLGYDRVMVYQLLHNGAGRVIAEQRRPGLPSFLNQHFPASDIPAQARELYKRNWIRMIGDARYTPQPVLPALAPGEAPLDMSYAQLRSVSPVHCEYLQNMGVAASLSISIIVEGELWGLIACHHYSPKATPLPLRIGAELFGQYVSLQVEALERRARFDASQAARARLDRIVAELPPELELHESLRPRIASLSQLVPCDGAGIWIGGQWIAHGATPDFPALKALTARLDKASKGRVWGSNRLRDEVPGQGFGEAVAGVLAVPVSRTPRDYLMFFRSEESRFVEWAGEPEKQVVAGPLGDRLTPRKSFELWREEVKGQSTPWTDADFAIADAVQNYLRDVVLRHTEATAEERKRTEVRRKLVNEELNHRVKNILAVTRSLVEHSRSGASTVEAYSAALNGRLRALAFAHDQMTNSKHGGDVRLLFEAEAATHGGAAAATRIHLDGPPVRLDPRAYSSLALAVHELSTNAAKYGALANDAGRIDVTWTLADSGDCVIEWVESGGLPVTPPSRRGFGSTLLQQAIPFDLDGEASIEYPPEGVRARFAIPAKFVLQPADGEAAAEAGPASAVRADLRGLKILLVEDQVLIALDAESSLRALGAAEVAIAATRGQAMRLLAAQTPDLAVLDINLGEGVSTPVAEELVRLGVPFVFATGYGDAMMIPEAMRGAPVIRKPYGEAALATALGGLLASAGKA